MTTVTPSSDITTTNWGLNGGSSFHGNLAANGANSVQDTGSGGTGQPLVMGSTFSGSGTISSATYSVTWIPESTGKGNPGDFSIELWKSGLGTKLAHFAGTFSSSTSKITSTGSLTIDDSTGSDWTNFSFKLFTDVLGGDQNQAQFFGLSVTITTGSPPGAPTGLTASYNSPTSLNLAWTQGSGTVTDNKVQYSTDNATWTTVDIGSAVTSYTLTGLTPNTLYYVQVAAANTNGTSSYSTYAYCPTQPTESVTLTLEPIADVTTTGWTKVGGSNFYGDLSDGSDSTYAIPPASTSEPLVLTLQTPPANLICVTEVQYNVRAETNSGGDTTGISASVQTSGASALFSAVGTGAITTSFANYQATGATPSGQQNLTAWTAAQLVLSALDTGQHALPSEASVTITYLIAAPPMMGDVQEGPGAAPNFWRCTALPRYVYRSALRLWDRLLGGRPAIAGAAATQTRKELAA